MQPPSGLIFSLCDWFTTGRSSELIMVESVVGSGISAENLSQDAGIQLFINAFATTAGLYGLITIFGPVSGAHFNPIVSLVDTLYGDMSLKNLGLYVLFQVSGGILGCILANVQFDTPTKFSQKERYGPELWVSELVATSTLILIIHGCIRTGSEASVPYAVSAWVGGGYFFTSSSIFANPAVTLARMFTNSFAGIDPSSAGVYICFQILGGLVGYAVSKLMYPAQPKPLKRDDNLYRRTCVLVNQGFFEKRSY